MRKKVLGILGAGLLNVLAGCAVIDKGDDFVYEDTVVNLMARHQHFSLENIVRERDTLYAGASAVEITPYNDQYMAGFNANRKSKGVHDDLFSRCIVLSYNDATIAFVALDLIGFMNENVEDVRALVAAIKGNFVDHVVIMSTHTHAGPDTIGMWGPGLPFLPLKSGIDKQYVGFVYDKIVESVYAAAKDLKKAKVSYASTTLTEKDRVSRNYHKELADVIDRDLSILRFSTPENKTIAAMTNFSAHPETLSRQNHEITSDFVGVFNKYMEQKLGGVSLYANGSIGGLITVDTDDTKDHDIPFLFNESERIGTTLGDKTIACLQNEVVCDKPVLKFYRTDFLVPVENWFFRWGNNLGIVAKRDFEGSVATEMDRIDIGNTIQMLTVPGELSPKIAGRIKSRMAKPVKIILGLGNDEDGYILPSEDFDMSVYSYERTMSLGRSIGTISEEKAKELLDKK